MNAELDAVDITTGPDLRVRRVHIAIHWRRRAAEVGAATPSQNCH
jgi:hypothetical protein